MTEPTLEPLASLDQGQLYLADGKTPARGASARVYARRDGSRVRIPVFADPQAVQLLAQPLKAGKDGRLAGFVDPSESLEVDGLFRGRQTLTASEAAAVRERGAAEIDRQRQAELAAEREHQRQEELVAEQQRQRREVIAAERKRRREEKLAAEQERQRQQKLAAAMDVESESVSPGPLDIEIPDGEDAAAVTISQRQFAASLDPQHGVRVIDIPPGFGVDSGDKAYYDVGQPPKGESKVLEVLQDDDLALGPGRYRLITPNGGEFGQVPVNDGDGDFAWENQSGISSESIGATKQGQVPSYDALRGELTADDGVHSPWAARAISITNLFTDPRGTTPANFASSAPGVPAPAAAGGGGLSTATAGGTIAAGTYEVQLTYVTAAGETLPGPVLTIVTTGATSTITIPSPAAVNGVTGWYAYVSQAGGVTPKRQQTPGSPTAIGTSLTLTAAPTNTGAAPPSSNTTAAGSVSQTPTNRADGFQQLASPKSCEEIVATPTKGGYIALQTVTATGVLRFAQVCAARMAAKVVSVAGGGSWHLALAVVYYNASAVKQGEEIVWTTPTQSSADSNALSTAMGATGGWVVAEGFDNQTPSTTTTYYELELRVYNDSGTPGAVTLRGTEIVETVDNNGDIPYYVGGDLGAALEWAPYFGTWLGTADASQSIGVFDPAGIYPDDTEFGFNNYGVVVGYESPANSVKLIRELGCTVSRENANLTGGQAAAPYIAPTLDAGRLANLQAVIAAGVKVILQTGPPSWMQPAGYGWPTDAPTQAQFAAAVVALITQLGPENVYGVQPYNEPNTRDSGGTSGAASPSTYSAFLTAVYTAVHAAYPSVKVFGGTLAAGLLHMNSPGMTADAFLAGMYSADAQYDVLDLHPYPPNGYTTVTGNTGPNIYYTATSAPSSPAYGVNFNMDQGFDANLAQIKNRMAANADSRPIFVSETGQLSVSERQQAQVDALLFGRLYRDPQVIGVCFNSIVDKTSLQSIPADWGPIDPKTQRRRAAARQFALMRAMPPPVWHDPEVLRLDPSAASGPQGSGGVNTAGTAGAVAALVGTANQVTIGYAGAAAIAIGGLGPTDTSAIVLRLPGSSGLTIQQGQLDNSHPTVTIKALPLQTNNLLSLQNSSGTANFAVAVDGSTISNTVMLAAGSSTTLTGSGALMETVAGVGYHTAYSFTAAAYLPVALLGTSTLVRANAGSVTITGVAGSPTAIVQGAAGQTADLLEVQNSSGGVLANVTSTGVIVAASGLQIPTGAAANKLAQSDASGNVSWALAGIANLSQSLIDALMPWTLPIAPWLAAADGAVIQGTWSNGGGTSDILNGTVFNITGAQNDEIGFYLPLANGTWTFSIAFTKGAANAIYTVNLDGVSIGTIDSYNASTTHNNSAKITGFTVATAGKHLISLKAATRNASSTGWTLQFAMFQLRRTA